MRYRIVFAPEAREDYNDLRAYERASVRDAINRHLPHQPDKVSKSRIKRLRDMETPQYRLRVGEIRVFYDIVGSEVQVLGIVPKVRASEWLARKGMKT